MKGKVWVLEIRSGMNWFPLEVWGYRAPAMCSLYQAQKCNPHEKYRIRGYRAEKTK